MTDRQEELDSFVTHRLTCSCGWDEEGTLSRLKRRAVSHGDSKRRHSWRITKPDEEVVESGP